CSLRALAFLTSSLTKVVSVGYWVMSHFRLRSVPGRLRLSSTVTCHTASTTRVAALTPRNPAPPVMSIRRDGPGSPLRAARGLDRVLRPDSARRGVGVIEGPSLKTIVEARPPNRRARPPMRRCQIRPSVSPATHPYHRRVTPPDRILSEPDTRSLRSNWEAETRMAGVYEALAGVASDAGLKRRLVSLSATEK